MEFKTCTKCETSKPLSSEFFHRHPLGKNGWHPQCKKCRNSASSKSNHSPESWEAELEKQRQRRVVNHEQYLEYLRTYCQNNKARLRQQGKEYVEKNREAVQKYRAQWRAENREHLLAEKRKYNLLNKHRFLPKKRIAAKNRWNSDPRFRVSKLVSHRMRQSITAGKNGRSWEALVDYSLDQLMAHLEKQFKPGMSWTNYGFYGWHVDHRKPIVSFSFSSVDDPEFKECFALTNLQPLWAVENMKKGAALND